MADQLTKEIHEAHRCLRELNHTIPSETLNFIRTAALRAAEKRRMRAAMDAVVEEILAMPEDEFQAELERHSDGDIARALEYAWEDAPEHQITQIKQILTDRTCTLCPECMAISKVLGLGVEGRET